MPTPAPANSAALTSSAVMVPPEPRMITPSLVRALVTVMSSTSVIQIPGVGGATSGAGLPVICATRKLACESM